MDLIEVDACYTQPLQAMAQRLKQGTGGSALSGKTDEWWSEFAGNEDGTPIGPSALTQQTLRCAIPINGSCIKEVEAFIQASAVCPKHIIASVCLSIAPKACI